MKRKQSYSPLRAYRKKLGVSQAAVAKMFGVSQAAWDRWEKQVAYPRRATAKRLVATTGITFEQLMGMSS